MTPKPLTDTLEPGEVYTAEEIRNAFGKGRVGKGIEVNYTAENNRYIRLFSTPESEYGDDLEATPMRYVGERNPEAPDGDQVAKYGNGALIESREQDTPVFLFEKVGDAPARYRFYGRVEVVGYELNYRPQKDKKEYDFYLRPVDADTSPSSTTPDQEREDDLTPGNLREITPTTNIEPGDEEEISYSSSKQAVAEGTTDHEQTVAALQDWLETAGYECQETEHTDILATRGETVLVMEIKSLSGTNDRTQIRKAVGQLTENAYRDVVRRGWGEKELVTCLGFSTPPADRFSGYLEFLRHYGIEVLWLKDGAVNGHHASQERVDPTT